jgi:ribosome-associated heat shock protein Hsp15
MDPVRLDRWLWAARLVKTRGLGAEAIKAGRVDVNGERAKPSRDVRPGDTIAIRGSSLRRTVVVRATAVKRVSASEAALLFEETEDSRELRERIAADRRLAGASGGRGGPRPTKRDRRRLDAARRQPGD